jgi:hypothetical protein
MYRNFAFRLCKVSDDASSALLEGSRDAIQRFMCGSVEVFSVVAYIGLVCGQVGGVGLLPAPVLALPLVRFWVVGVQTLMIMTVMVIETSVQYVPLTRLIAREDYIKFTRRESIKTYMTLTMFNKSSKLLL